MKREAVEQLILTNQRTSAVVLMPIRAKRKNFPDGYDKNARFSVKMLIVFCMSSSYPLDAKSSSGGTRIFHAGRGIQSSETAQPLEVIQTTAVWTLEHDEAHHVACAQAARKNQARDVLC